MEAAGTAVSTDETHAVQAEAALMYGDLATPVPDLEVSTAFTHVADVGYRQHVGRQ
jgi:hypothetical protein